MLETGAMAAQAKSEYLQIRVAPREKAEIQRLARAAGRDMSSYVISRVLPAAVARFGRLVTRLGRSSQPRFVLAEIGDLLSTLTASQLQRATADRPPGRLTPYLENYLCAMIETAAQRVGAAIPDWVNDVEPLAEPVFGSELESLRLYLLTHSPPAFRYRNIFIDASIGDRV